MFNNFTNFKRPNFPQGTTSQYTPSQLPSYTPSLLSSYTPSNPSDLTSGNYKGILSGFTSNKYVAGANDFLQSNGLVAKFAFLILAIMIFIVLLRVGMSIITWILTPSSDPILINGMIDSRQMIVIEQDPSKKGSVPIIRSVNDADGLEFTWSVWMYIDDYTYKQDKYKHVFHKGNDNIGMDGINHPNNAPGVYLDKHTNNLVVFVNTFNDANEKIYIEDIPMQKWVNVIIRVIQHQVDIYINGTLTKRHILEGIPKQNYGNVYASMNGGFSGNTSDLRYFNSGIGTTHIQSIVNTGPNLKLIKTSKKSSQPDTHYLSTRWFFAETDYT